ncbi:ABC transporter permease [Anaeromyxobacter paludicola]|uniref:LolC/E family lipoprotein releasing system, protein n=1 Tax=Anaeromyxobacter paludicola TaxID=2918171 RepID=A0ABM7X5I7_9BACT|nr:FtsX-like permease family protein [Anaeromyxobacter paludicola]BDG07067.1 LolC/E family lipoprotein releasing system, protein [Anaeromyxobacter paludicola]
MAWVAGRYAVRSVRRNLRRTALSVLGVAVGCALAILTDSFNRGTREMYARAGAESGAGHLRVAPAGWRLARDPRLRLADWRRDLAAARGLPGVAAATPRARAEALLAMGTHVAPVELAGVDAETEPATYRFVRRIARGRYLAPGEEGAAVVGAALAERLRAGLGDEVLATAVGRGGRIEGLMLRIVGVVATGSEEIDAGICQVALADVERLTGLPGASEVTLLLRDWKASEPLRPALAAAVAPGDEVLTWGELSPEFRDHLRQDAATSRLVTGVVLLVVLLGVASAQLAAVLERRREFAVLSAMGMSAARMVRLVVLEALALGVAGAVAGLALALPLCWRFAARGLDFSRWMGASYAFQGVIVEPVVRGDLGPWILPEALLVSLGATLAASLYPAWFAARTDPAAALRVAR